MSRIGKMPIPLPEQVEVELDNSHIRVTGPLGELSRDVLPEVKVDLVDRQILVSPVSEEREARARHGLVRTLIANMVEGVSRGFRKELELYGVGYRAQLQGRRLVLQVGYSHPMAFEAPEEIDFAVETFTPTSENDYLSARIAVSGIDKELLGQVAANIRAARKPEPYKGKGIRYRGEQVRRKPGKAAATGKKGR